MTVCSPSQPWTDGQQAGLVTVGNTSSAGRGWLASCDIPAGSVVYSTTPSTRLRVIDLALATKVCQHCGGFEMDDE